MIKVLQQIPQRNVFKNGNFFFFFFYIWFAYSRFPRSRFPSLPKTVNKYGGCGNLSFSPLPQCLSSSLRKTMTTLPMAVVNRHPKAQNNFQSGISSIIWLWILTIVLDTRKLWNMAEKEKSYSLIPHTWPKLNSYRLF